MSSPIDDYIEQLRNELRSQADHIESETVLREVREHLDESTRELCSEGKPSEDAEETAVALMGDPEMIARAFDRHREKALRIRTGLVICAAIALCVILLLNALPDHRPRPLDTFEADVVEQDSSSMGRKTQVPRVEATGEPSSSVFHLGQTKEHSFPQNDRSG